MSHQVNRISQQIVISGVGGQGVLFVTRLLAETAILKGLPVFTSETHGMAQRGGTVISSLKVGRFSSPLVRPGKADLLLCLRAETLAQHESYLKSGGVAVINAETPSPRKGPVPLHIDADRIAVGLGDARAANLVLLGFAFAVFPDLFCGISDVRQTAENLLSGRPAMLSSAIAAMTAGRGRRP